MFCRKIRLSYETASDGGVSPCPLRWIDSFLMRNFTNDSIFDETLPVADGLIEVGNRVPLDALRASAEDWFRKKGFIKPGDRVLLEEQH